MSDEEIKILLRENLELNRETLSILKKLNKARIWGNVFWIVKWVIIIGLSFGAYYYIEPYLSRYLNFLENLQGSVENVNKISNNINSIGASDLIENLRNFLPK